jgi:hypothetical protein
VDPLASGGARTPSITGGVFLPRRVRCSATAVSPPRSMTSRIMRDWESARYTDAAGTQLSSLIKNTASTVVQDPDTIERSLGKMRRIIDTRTR